MTQIYNYDGICKIALPLFCFFVIPPPPPLGNEIQYTIKTTDAQM